MDANNLVMLYREAAPDNGGVTWYRDSRRYARHLAQKHGVRQSVAAGVIAALSPRVHWSRTKAMADELLATGQVRSYFAGQVEKARRIVAGERPLAVLGGPKTREFYRAIMGHEDAAVLDTWMLKALGHTHPHGKVTPKQYEQGAAALREAAARVGLGTATFQAVVWTHIRGRAE